MILIAILVETNFNSFRTRGIVPVIFEFLRFVGKVQLKLLSQGVCNAEKSLRHFIYL